MCGSRDRRHDPALFTYACFTHQFALKLATTQQAFRFNPLVQRDVPPRFEHRHHRASARAARRAIALPVREDVHIPIQRIRAIRLVPKGHKVNVVDVRRFWVLHLNFAIELFLGD